MLKSERTAHPASKTRLFLGPRVFKVQTLPEPSLFARTCIAQVAKQDVRRPGQGVRDGASSAPKASSEQGCLSGFPETPISLIIKEYTFNPIRVAIVI